MAGKGLDDEFAAFLEGSADTKVVDTKPDGRLLKIPLGRLAPNGVNPRTEFGTPEELLDFGKSLARRQNQACPVVSRRAYLKLWPDHNDRIGDIDYVLVSGERRYRAATEVGLESLQCVVDDAVAQTRQTFMEAVVSENVDRQNFDPIEEANAVQALVNEFGNNRKVAEHFERADGWVTQRINLTYLCPELQQLVRAKDIPLEDARTLGKLVKNQEVGNDAAAQLTWWEETKDAKARKAEARRAERAARKAAQQAASAPEAQESFTAVKQSAASSANVPSAGPGPAQPAHTALPPAGPTRSEAAVSVSPAGEPAAAPTATTVVPDPLSSATAPQPTATSQAEAPDPAGPVQPMPPTWDGAQLMDAVIERMDDLQLSRLVVRYLAHTGNAGKLAAHLSLSTPYEHRLRVANLLAAAADLLKRPPAQS